MDAPLAKPRLPAGVELRDLEMHADDRGIFTEIFRKSWSEGPNPVQWNAVRSAKNVLRGVHVHLKHHDYLVVVAGTATIGLKDLRRNSPTTGLSSMVPMQGDALRGISVPPGVAHGFYFHEASIHIYSVSEYWDHADELGCRWDDAGLGLEWPGGSPQISDSDALLPSLEELEIKLASSQDTL